MNLRRFAQLSAVPLFSLFALGLAGCAQAMDQELAEASVQSALQTSRNSGVGKVVFDAVDPTACLDPAAAAAEAAARPTAGLYPSSCVAKTADGADLHVELDDCTGPFGRVHLDGGLDATFTASACDKLHAEVVDSGDLTANQRDLEYSASAEITVDGDLRNVDWAGHWSTTTRMGKEAEQTSDLAIVVHAQSGCLDVSGTTKGHLGDHDFDSTIEGLSVCPDACPAAGTVRVTAEGWRRERSLLIEFDGSNVAKVTIDDEDVHEVEMVCDADE